MHFLKKAFLLLVLLFSFFSEESKAQRDSVFLLNGEIVSGTIKDTSLFDIIIERTKKNGKTKDLRIHKDLVFSIWYKNSEKILYRQDTMAGNYFTPEEVRLFIYGERDADKNYRNWYSGVGGFIVGAGSMVWFNNVFYAMIPPFVYSAAVVYIPKVRIRPHTITSKEFLKYDTYIMGYEKVARKKIILNALKGSFVGLAAGVAYILIVDK